MVYKARVRVQSYFAQQTVALARGLIGQIRETGITWVWTLREKLM